LAFSKNYYLLKRHWYGITNSMRVLPNFIIIGAAKSGTTSLYHYFNKHPSIMESLKKEIGYFDDNYNLGVEWYRTWFPTKSFTEKVTKINGKCLVYEASPGYFQKPWSIERIHNTLPDIKLILVLRNPVDRTYSHYQHSTRRGIKTKTSFRELLDRDFKKFEKIREDNYDEYFRDFVLSTYIGPSIYVKLVEEWMKVFNEKQLLIFSTEELSNDSEKVFERIFDFLNINDTKISTSVRENVGGYADKLDDDLREKLIEFFRPYNERLYEKIGQTFDWDK
tara:strand:- start:743 stop:1579 length:837 start_codon:yes stop_codon:yes gene_type:complete